MALDSAADPNNINVVECKGTQSSRKDVRKAVGGGIPQKKNLVSAGSSKINHTLVAGLFIPPKKSKEEALIYLSDPPQEGLSEVFARIAPERMQTGVIQIDLAKHFALMGLHSIADALASTDSSAASHLPDVDRQEIRALTLSSDKRELTFEISFLLPRGRTHVAGQPVSRAKFAMTCPLDLYDRVAGKDDLEGTLGNLVETAGEREWHEDSDVTALEINLCNASQTNGIQPRAEVATGEHGNAPGPAFQTNPLKPYAHPYYWVPFILIGNWR